MLLSELGMPTSYPAYAWPELRATMNLDKKARAQSLRFVILEGLARATILESPDEGVLQAAFESLSGG